MTSFGKIIRLFLVDGTTNGLTTAELSNWTGIGVRLPKIKVKEFNSRPEFQKPGVYILFGKNDNNEDFAYIGETELVGKRLLEQIKEREFWNEVIFFSSKDKYLNKASVKYLENRLHELALKAGRYKLVQSIPTRSELSEAEQAELEEFLTNIKVLSAALGHKIFETLEETVEVDNEKEQIFYCRNTAGAFGKGSPSTEGFVVFKGALLIIQEQLSLSESIRSERKKMLEDGTLIQQGIYYELTKDYIFNSSSRAAAAIVASSISGPREWKTESGVPLKQFE